MSVPEQPVELSPRDADPFSPNRKLHFGTIEGWKHLPHHLFYAWDATYAYALCGAVETKRGRDRGDPDMLALSIGNGDHCEACHARCNELEAAYYDNHRQDT